MERVRDMKYRTIVADPPWDYEGFATAPQGERNRGLKPKVADLPYGAMTVDEIKTLPVCSLADVDCRLFMWTTNPSPFGGSVAPGTAEMAGS